MTSSPDNRIPTSVRRIHLIAVCGTGMGALAAMLQEAGYTVTGSDQKVYPPMSDFLASRGIAVTDGFRAENLSPRPDLVVVGNAVRRENPEAEAMRALGIPFCSMPQALNAFFGAGKKTLIVTGTHGKTTTSALLAWLLTEGGYDPTVMVGGIMTNFGGNFRIGQGEYLVVEGDEYDTAYFDKGPKFLHFTPHRAILTSVEFDHADIYPDLDAVTGAFRRLVRGIPASSLLVAHEADGPLSEVLAEAACGVERYGIGETSDWTVTEVSTTAAGTRFTVRHKGTPFHTFTTPLMGEHNLLNALSAIAVAASIGMAPGVIARGLSGFRGVKRRQEIRGVRRGITVIDDFAHHPTAVRETIRAVKPHFPGGRLIAVFEPRTNTSMRSVFQEIYPASFREADLVCIREAPLLSRIPEGERFSARQLVSDIRRMGVEAREFPDADAIIPFLVETARAGDVILIMSNGGFENIHQRLLEAL